ncbi:MAG TPA: twin-arginine translocase subunit TatC [Planctomycetota bacterium]|nr:twin-arginine translocase subunit TatC [Planctomycetota bacterium]
MVTLDDPKIRAVYEDEQLPRMSFGDHLDELRKRLIRSLIAIVVAIVALLPFKGPVQGVIIEPYRVQWRHGFTRWVETLEAREAAGELAHDKLGTRYLGFCREYKAAILAGEMQYSYNLPAETGYPVPYNLFATGGLEDMMSFMWASLVFALVLAAPVVIWQAWAFIAAGLYRHERRVFYRYFPFMMVLLVSGAAFGYWIALPYTLGFLFSVMDPSQVGALLSIGQFLSLLFAMTGAMGLVFQVPLVMIALQRVGLVTHRAFLKNWRMTVLIIFVVAAVFTPPDPVSMLLMSAPMLLLYGLGLVLTGFGRKHEAAAVVVTT